MFCCCALILSAPSCHNTSPLTLWRGCDSTRSGYSCIIQTLKDTRGCRLLLMCRLWILYSRCVTSDDGWWSAMSFLTTRRLSLMAPNWTHASVPELSSGSEGLGLCDGEDQQEALPAAKVVVPDSSIVLLPGGVQDVDLSLLPVQNHLFPVAVCFGGLVVLHKLHVKRQSSGAWSAVTQQANMEIRRMDKNACRHAAGSRSAPRHRWGPVTAAPLLGRSGC